MFAAPTTARLPSLSFEQPWLAQWNWRTSLEQNPEIAETLRLTYPRPIEHDTGRLENLGTALPGSKFAQIFEEIRQELIHAAR